MPIGVALTRPSADRTLASRSVTAVMRSSLKAVASLSTSAAAFAGVLIEYSEMGDADFEKGIGHREARAAGADENYPVDGRPLHAAAKALDEAPAIGVVPDRGYHSEHDRIDRADSRRVRERRRQGAENVFLERMRNIKARETALLRDADNRVERLVVEGHLIEIQQTIAIAKAEAGSLRFMHPRRPRFLDASADESGDERSLAGHRADAIEGGADGIIARRRFSSARSVRVSGIRIFCPSDGKAVVRRAFAVMKRACAQMECGRTSSYSQFPRQLRRFSRGRDPAMIAQSRKKVTPPNRTNDPEGTQRNIIEVAYKEFAENGLSGARIDEIAAKTKSSKRMIYYYFGDKEGLYLKVLEAAYSEVRAEEATLDLEDSPPRQALEKLVRFTFDHHNNNEDFIRLVMIENIHNGEFLAKSSVIQQLNVRAIGAVADLYERGVRAGIFRAGPRSGGAALADQRALLLQCLQSRHLFQDLQARPRLEEVAGGAPRPRRRHGRPLRRQILIAPMRAELRRLTRRAVRPSSECTN